jgi:hypothetical protein
MTTLIACEHECLKFFEGKHEAARSDFIRPFRKNQASVSEVIKGNDKAHTGIAPREHIRRISEMWNAIGERAREAYEAWNTTWMQTQLIDIIASAEAQEIPLKYGGCPICQEFCGPFYGSSSKVFQKHCKRKYGVDSVLSVNLTVFALSKILKRDITSHSKSTRVEFINSPVPVCFHENCSFHARACKSVKYHMETDCCLLSSPQLGFFLHLLLRNPQL